MSKGVTVVPQRKNWDCGIAALAMFLDKPYGDIAAAVRTCFPDTQEKIKKAGLNIEETMAISGHFGVSLVKRHRRKNNEHLTHQTGILGLLGTRMHWAGHWVILKDGMTVIDPDGGSVWALAQYLNHWDARACTLLVREE